MSALQEQVNRWFADNPNATGEQVVAAIQSVGGLDAHAGLTDILAARYGVAPNEITNYYNINAAPAPAAATPAYFQQNPDVAAAFQQNSYGMTPEQFAATHFEKFGANEQREAPTPAPTAAPVPVQTVASGPSWDYDKYYESLKSGDANYQQELGKLGGVMGENAQNVYREILAQQNAGTAAAWYAGNTASPQAAAADFALRLAENGIGSLSQLGQIRTPDDPDSPSQEITINKLTGQPLPRPELLGRGTRGLDINYNIQFAPDGTALPYTSDRQSSWMQFREDTLKPAALLIGSFIPGAAPYIAAANAANAASKGDWGTAVVSALTAIPGFNSVLKFSPETLATLNQAKTGAQVINAIDKGNSIAVVNALMQTDTGKDLLQMDMGSGVTLGNVLNTARVAAAVDAGDYAGAANYAGSLLNNPDLKIAGSSLALVNAIKSEDPFKIAAAMGQLDKNVKTATNDSGGGITNRVVDDAITQGGITNVLSDAGLITGDDTFAADAAAMTGSEIDKLLASSGLANAAGSQDIGEVVAGPGQMTTRTVASMPQMAARAGEIAGDVREKTETHDGRAFVTYQRDIFYTKPDGTPGSYTIEYSPGASAGRQIGYGTYDYVDADGNLVVGINRTRPDISATNDGPAGSGGAGVGATGEKTGETTIGGKSPEDYAQEVLDLISQTNSGSSGPSVSINDLISKTPVAGTAGTGTGTTDTGAGAGAVTGPNTGTGAVNNAGAGTGASGAGSGGGIVVSTDPSSNTATVVNSNGSTVVVNNSGGSLKIGDVVGDSSSGSGAITGPGAGVEAGAGGSGEGAATGTGGSGAGEITGGPGVGPGTDLGTGLDVGSTESGPGTGGEVDVGAGTNTETSAGTSTGTSTGTETNTGTTTKVTPAQVAKTLSMPSVSGSMPQDVMEALYGTMEYLDIGEEFDPSNRKVTPAATQKQLQQTKMAQGGYLDNLLAENMSVDDLLKLLR